MTARQEEKTVYLKEASHLVSFSFYQDKSASSVSWFGASLPQRPSFHKPDALIFHLKL